MVINKRFVHINTEKWTLDNAHRFSNIATHLSFINDGQPSFFHDIQFSSLSKICWIQGKNSVDIKSKEKSSSFWEGKQDSRKLQSFISQSFISRVQTPLESWLFQASIRNCLNCVHNCDDHSLIDFIYLSLQICKVEMKSTITQTLSVF